MLGESEYETFITGADSYSPDGRLILNESAEVKTRFKFVFVQLKMNLD